MKETIFKIESGNIEVNLNEWFHLNWFGDIHQDTENFEKQRFKKFINDTLMLENPYYFGMGDYNDFASTSEKKAINSANIHDSTRQAFDLMAQRSNVEMAKLLQPIKGRILGLMSGNHVWRFDNGKLSDEDLAERLNTKCLGYLCAYMLRIKITNRKYFSTDDITIPIFLCHGKGGGRLLGTSFNKVNQMAEIIPNCLIYAMGHDHKLGAIPDTKLMFVVNRSGGQKLKEVKQYYIRTGSFMKGYVDNTSHYATSGLMKPSTLGGATIRCMVVRKRDDGSDYLSIEMQSLI